jgi:hypothetical protein
VFGRDIAQHADEALAAYFGYRTYASLKAVLPEAHPYLRAKEDAAALVARLSSLGLAVRPTDIDRILRLFRSEMMGRMSENFKKMAAAPANDNR